MQNRDRQRAAKPKPLRAANQNRDRQRAANQNRDRQRAANQNRNRQRAAKMIGVRREDKSKWEARAPLVPDDVRCLTDEHGLRFQVQTSPIRVFRDDQYRAAGAEIVEDLAECPIILGVKEIPAAGIEPGKTYAFFSHTIKRQPASMPMLRRIVELGCTLIDYECIVDQQGRRLVFFGRYAGLAGMIDTLWALGQRLRHEGIENPFSLVRRAYEYDSLEHAKREIARVGEQIRQGGLPATIQPLVCGLSGYGNVSQGAQEILDLLPVRELAPDELPGVTPAPVSEPPIRTATVSERHCYKVVFREEHLVQRVSERGERSEPRPSASAQSESEPRPSASGQFDLQDYYDHPQRYRSKFFPYVHHLTVLVNCIYWDTRYPRLVTCDQLRELFSRQERPRLRVIGDITCDIGGSIECTVRATEPGDPVYVYEPRRGEVQSGVAGDGPVILAVDILPCELPVDASTHFGFSLSPLIPALARADFGGGLDQSGLGPELRRATIVYKGELTEPYRYLESEIR